MILNFVINAAEAMTALEEGQRSLRVCTRLDQDRVLLQVIDRGHGIAQDASARLFDPFWGTKSHGLGVGLAICRAIIEAHDGSIGASNNSGAGATFWFSLPTRAD